MWFYQYYVKYWMDDEHCAEEGILISEDGTYADAVSRLVDFYGDKYIEAILYLAPVEDGDTGILTRQELAKMVWHKA